MKFLAYEASVSVEFSALKSQFPYFWTSAKCGESEKAESSPHFARIQKYENRLSSAENSTETLASQVMQFWSEIILCLVISNRTQAHFEITRMISHQCNAQFNFHYK